MGHVFISYSRRDRELVDVIVDKLEGTGLDIWIDRDDIRAGRQWRMQIVEAIDTADSFVLHLSPHSAASKNVRKELDLAEDSPEAFVLPVMLAEIDIPAEMRYQLAGTQRIAFYADPKGSYEELEETLLERQRALENKKGSPSHREVELVIKEETLVNFGNEKRAELLALLSELTEASSDKFVITRVEEGSLHVFVKMPVQVAYELKAIALEEAHLLAKHGISEVRFVGDKKFIPTSKSPKSRKFGFFQKTLLWGASILLSAALIYGGWQWSKRPAAPQKADTPVPVVTATETAPATPSSTQTSTTTPTMTPTLTLTPTATATCQPPEYSIAGSFCWSGNRYISIDVSDTLVGVSDYSVTVDDDALSCAQYHPGRLSCGAVPPQPDHRAIISVCDFSRDEGGEICSCATFSVHVDDCPIWGLKTPDPDDDPTPAPDEPVFVCNETSCDLYTDKATCEACGCDWEPENGYCLSP